ncbi:hypothetical protein MKW94_010688 [Papaver nudicaule]|uniref:Uncharacterized protein n=1 Tax=Papaver nudicaule TaxID=74823 RepID=A0AA42B4U4_PAPNU|nr:hypothetical protein [Papaver nudicaule]
MKDRNLLDSNDAKFPQFSKEKHQILCSELKKLYVAITRTRQRLWICENKDDFSKPMFDYWKKLCLVQVRELDESLVQAMQVMSSKEEWSSRGIKLLDEGNFEMATMCFERAGDSFLEKLAKASGLRAAGVHMLGSNTELARVALVEAAEIYESIGKADFAAKCFMELKDFKRAGIIYLENCGESRLEDAAESENFMEAATVARLKGDRLLEADMLEKAGQLEDAAEVILFYVLSNSLWANGNKEANTLSDVNIRLSEMKDCFVASQRLESLRGEIISLRKIIDYHLDLAPSEYIWVDNVVFNTVEHVENSISKNRVSVETLTYFWILWKEKIVNILNYLNSLETQDKQDYKILKKLESLNKISGKFKNGNHPCMQYSGHFRRAITALNSYQVANSVIECKMLEEKLPVELLKCWRHSKELFLALYFMTDPDHMMCKHMMVLRLTELSKDLMEEVSINFMSAEGKLDCMEIWSVVLQIFMFGNLSDELYQVIIQRSDLSPAYRVFIKQLKESKISGLVSVSLVSNFEKSLQETFNYDWAKDFDCMAPSWFVYFLERLLFLVSSWHNCFFTVKSSLYETIPWGNLRCNSSSLSVADSKLVLCVALICLNSGCHFDLLYSLLGRYDIITVLPPAFVKILKKRGTRPFDKLLAESLETIGDPLVWLRSGDIRREYLSHDVLEIDVDLIHSREDLLGILYPENSERDRNDEMENVSPSDEISCFSSVDHTSYTECPIESDDGFPDYYIESAELETETENLNESFSHFFENAARVYLFSKKMFSLMGVSFLAFEPQMKVCFMLVFLFIFLFD